MEKLSTERKDREKVLKNNCNIALDILDVDNVYVDKGKLEIKRAYISGCNFERKIQVVLLLIKNCETLHYLAVIRLYALLKGKISENYGVFFVICIHLELNKLILKKYVKLIILSSYIP